MIALFTPQRDMTAFELAVIVGRVRMPSLKVTFTGDSFDKLPVEIKRHFSPIDGDDSPSNALANSEAVESHWDKLLRSKGYDE